MDEKTQYYKFIVGSVIVRRTGLKIEKIGKKGVWEDASHMAYRFIRDDDMLVEITEEEAKDLLAQRGIDL
ncbi:MAG: hypothetical protein II842_12835 [Butyrivibrio sp.]|nr:hypothetical protein [Butyrivibrio sp.]